MDEDLLERVLAAFGRDRPSAPATFVARGAMGEVWKVDLAGGPVAVKALLPWADAVERPADIDVQLAAAAAGVELPAPLLDGEGRAVVAVDGRRYRAYEWVDLDDELDPPLDADLAREAGAQLGRIHALGLPVPAPADDGESPVDRWYRAPPSKDRLVALARAGTSDARHWSYALIASFGMIDELLAAVGFVTESPVAPPAATPIAGAGPAVLSHRDFSLRNVIPRRADGRLVVIDWENAGPIDPDQELAAALVDLATSRGTAAPEAVAGLLDGYRSAGGCAVMAGGPSFRMAVCTTLNYLVVLAEQALSDDPYAEVEIDGLLGAALPNLASVVPPLAGMVAGA